MKIYKTASCIHCREFIDELDKRGIEYELPDLDDPSVREEALKIVSRLGKDELPLVVKDGKEYSRPTLEELGI
jgi:glutaredoxin